MSSRPRRRSVSARGADRLPTEHRHCPDCSRPIAEHSIRRSPDEGEVLHNDALKVTCWKTLGRVTREMRASLARPGVLPPIARRARRE